MLWGASGGFAANGVIVSYAAGSVRAMGDLLCPLHTLFVRVDGTTWLNYTKTACSGLQHILRFTKPHRFPPFLRCTFSTEKHTHASPSQDFSLKTTHKDGVLANDLKATYDNPRYKLITTLAQATGKLGLAVTAKALAPGVNVGVSGTIPDIDSAKVAVDYVAPHITLNATSSLSAAPIVDVAATSRFSIRSRDVIGGGKVSYDASKGSIKEWILGMGYTAADYQVAATYNDKKDVTALIAHSVRPDLTVGAQVTRNVESATTAMYAGVTRRLASGATQKVKVAHTGVVSVLHQQPLEGKSIVSLSGEFDAKDPSKAPKYGFGLDVKY
jgi:voltage-dependent anion channel protein 2